jgi:hypothetical protein
MVTNLTAALEVKGIEKLLISSISFFKDDIESIALRASQNHETGAQKLLDQNISFQDNLLDKVFDTLSSSYRDSSFGVSIYIGINVWVQNAKPEILNFLEVEITLAAASFNCILKFNHNLGDTHSNQALILAHSQVPLDAQVILRLLELICVETEPKFLYLYTGKRQVAPWHYHLIYHHLPEDHVEDINNFLNTPSEKILDPSEASPLRDNTEALSKIQKVFDYLYTKLIAFNLPTEMTQAELAQIWAESSDASFTSFTADEGIGVYATQIRGKEQWTFSLKT